MTPIHLAFHYLGCAQSVGDGVAVPSRVGPLFDCLAALVDRLTVVAYDPPRDPVPVEDGVEYIVRSPAGNVDVLSLGDKGSLRSYVSRRRRVHRIVSDASGEWDAIVFQLANRRSDLVFRACRTGRVAALIVGHSATAIRGAPWSLPRKAAGMLRALIEDRHVDRIVRRAGFILTNSDELERRYRGSNEVDIVPMSPRRARYEHLEGDRMSDGLEAMISGRVAAEKGVFDALEAFAAVQSDFSHARLHVVGDGPALAGLLSRARELGVADSVVSHGWIPVGRDLYDLYAQMDVLLLPSTAEGLPYTVWEALAHSVLVVCTPVGGLGDAFGNNEEVLFVPPGSPAAIADALRRLAGDPSLRQRLLHNGYERARTVTVESVADALVAKIGSTWALGSGVPDSSGATDPHRPRST